MKRLLSIISISVVVSTTILQILTVQSTSAATFNPNNIIDDVVFDNANTMSVAAIDSFLNTFTNSCISPNSGFRAIDPTGYSPTNAFSYGGYVTAGKVIYDAAQAYTINPQVLIATLEKEQSLVTGRNNFTDYCNNGDQHKYAAAVGYGCPDGGSVYKYNGLSVYQRNGVVISTIDHTCVNSALKAGFSQQVIRAAWLLKFGEQRSEGNIGWAVVKGNWDNSDDPESCYGGPMTQGTWERCPSGGATYYSGDKTIDNTVVHMNNGATASLYWYTPHFHGNQIFFDIFTSWFGSTLGTPFFKLSDSAATYVLGVNDSYYSIKDYERLKDYGFENAFSLRVNTISSADKSKLTYKGNLPAIARFEGNGVYILSNGKRLPFPSEQMLYNYGYNFGQEALLPKWMASNIAVGTQVEQVVQPSDGTAMYYVVNGEKQPFCNWDAYTKLGAPTYNTRPYVILRTFYLNTLPDGEPIASEGDLIKSSGLEEYGLWQNTTYSSLSPEVAKNTNATNCAVSSIAVTQLPTGSAINNLVKDTSGNLFILDKSKKLSINSQVLNTLGLSANSFSTVSSAFLGRIPTTAMSTLVRVDGGAGVYLLADGKKYSIPSEADLYGLGYSFNEVLNITKSTFDLVPSGGVMFKPGRVVRINNGIGVYLLEDGFKKYSFPSEQVFLGYGYNWTDVVNVSTGTLQAYSDNGTVVRYVRDSSGTFWLVDAKLHHHISTELTGGTKYNVTASNSILVSTNTLNQSKVGADLTNVFRAGSGRGVYKIEAGTRRVYSSESVFLSSGNQWSDVISLSPDYVNTLPVGSPIQ